MRELNELIELLELAIGPDRSLDRKIGIACLGWAVNTDLSSPSLMIDGDYYADAPGGAYPSPTESLDVAMTLVPLGSRVEIKYEGEWAAAVVNPDTGRWPYSVDDSSSAPSSDGAPTPALALCIASLKAIHALRNV